MSPALKSKQQIPSWFKNDPYWNSALYILENLVRRDSMFLSITQSHVSFEDSRISFPAMKRDTEKWSRGERIMIDLAAHLFNERNEFNLSDLDLLDSTLKKIAMEAIRRRFAM